MKDKKHVTKQPANTPHRDFPRPMEPTEEAPKPRVYETSEEADARLDALAAQRKKDAEDGKEPIDVPPEISKDGTRMTITGKNGGKITFIRPPKRVPPTFEPFERNRQEDGSYITTWRHPDGQTEQWHGDGGQWADVEGRMTLTVLPGRVAVVWPLASTGLLEVPDWVRRSGEQVRGDKLECKRVTVLDSKYPGLHQGDVICVRADASCLALEPGEYPFVPEDSEIRIYGVHEPIQDGSPRGAEERGQDIVMWREA